MPDKGEATTSATPRRRRRVLKWLGLGVLLLVLAAVVTVQMVLWSDYPRRLVVAQLERELGLRVEAGALETGWFGHTRLQDVTIALPLADDAFFRAPVMKVEHTSLIPLLLGYAVEVEAVTLESPTLIARQDRHGAWDLQQVVELFTRVSGQEQAQEAGGGAGSSRRAAAALPRVTMTGATLRLVPRAGEAVEIGPIVFTGRPADGLTWEYTARAGAAEGVDTPLVTAQGRLVPGGDYRHVVALGVRDIGPWVAPFAPWWPEPVALDAAWEGAIREGTLTGTLDIAESRVAQVAARGTLQVAANAEHVVVRPRNFSVAAGVPLVPTVRLRSGSVWVDRTGVRVADLTATARGGTATVDGQYALATGEGEVTAVYRDVPAGPVQLTGKATAVVDTTPDGEGRRVLSVATTTTVETPVGQVRAVLSLEARAADVAAAAYTLTLQEAGWSAWPEVAVADVSAAGEVTRQRVTVRTVTAAGQPGLTGSGFYDWSDGTWSATFAGKDFRAGPVPPLTFRLATTGTREQAVLSALSVRAGGIEVDASGDYVYARPKPLELTVKLADADLAAPFPSGATTRRAMPLQGQLRGTLRVDGTLAPVEIGLAGTLNARNLALRSWKIGDIDIDILGKATDERLTLATTELELLNARWKLSAVYPTRNDLAQVDVAVRGLPLRSLAQVLALPAERTPELGGVASGAFVLEGGSLDVAAIRGEGKFAISKPEWDPALAQLPTLAAEQATATLSLDNGRVDVGLEAREGAGRFNGTMVTTFDAPERLALEVNLDAWPLPLGANQAQLRLSGNAKGTLNADTLKGELAGNARAQFWYEQQLMADARTAMALNGRTITLTDAAADIFNGTAEGRATIRLDSLMESTGTLAFRNIDGGRFGLFYQQLEPLRGTFSGTATLAQADEPRPLEPLKLTAALDAREAGYGALTFGDARLVAYASNQRIVLHNMLLRVAKGRMSVWGRVVKKDGAWQTAQARVGIDSVELNQVVHVLRPDAEAMPGKVSGAINALAPVGDWRALAGDGVAELKESDLVNWDVVGALYDLMNVNIRGRQPTGSGRVDFRFEQGNAYISNLTYSNRGIHIRGTGSVENVLALPESPLNFVAAGTARPLRNTKVPVLAELDEIVGVLQSQVTTVRATGTVAEPKVGPVVLQEAGQALKELLVREVRER